MLLGILASGLVYGSLAGLNAIGFVLLWRSQRLVNLAQPSLGLVGGTVTGLLVVSGGWSFWAAAPVGLLLGATIAYGIDLLVFRRLRDAPRTALLVVSVGIAALLAGISSALPFVVGGPLPTYSIDLGIQWDIFPVKLLGPHILTLILFPLAALAVWLFLRRTKVGLAALALGQDQEKARTLGVPANFVYSVVWVAAGVLSTIAGILSIPVLGFNLGGGLAPLVLILSLAPAALAGMRSVAGAAAAAIAVGIAYRWMFFISPEAGFADLILAVSLMGAVAFHGNRLGRGATVRVSAWELSMAIRPLPRRIARSWRIRLMRAGLVGLCLTVGIVLALGLPAGDRVIFAGSAAIAIAVLSVAVAWLFTGEVVLGQWGFAGLGAAVALVTPGGWILRGIAATLALVIVGGVLAVATRGRSTLGFSIMGLAAAAAAPVAVLRLGRDTISTDPHLAGAIAVTVLVLATFIVSDLRASTLGRRMVAARDDPVRGPWLGADPTLMRVVGLGLASGLAGLAGVMYLAAVPAGIAPGAFASSVSLDVLAMAVVGGLGSPVGAVAGAVVVQSARYLLTEPWGSIASGLGVILVVMFLPGGIGRVIDMFWHKLGSAGGGPVASVAHLAGEHEEAVA